MKLYLLSLLIILLCITFSESYEKRGKRVGAELKDSSVPGALQNGKKFGKRRPVKKRKQKETKIQPNSKLANKSPAKRKPADQKSPRLRKKQKKMINMVANDQPSKNLETKRAGGKKFRLVKRRKQRKGGKPVLQKAKRIIRDKKSSDFVNDQPASSRRLTKKTSKSDKRLSKQSVAKKDKNSNVIVNDKKSRIMNDQPANSDNWLVKHSASRQDVNSNKKQTKRDTEKKLLQKKSHEKELQPLSIRTETIKEPPSPIEIFKSNFKNRVKPVFKDEKDETYVYTLPPKTDPRYYDAEKRQYIIQKLEAYDNGYVDRFSPTNRDISSLNGLFEFVNEFNPVEAKMVHRETDYALSWRVHAAFPTTTLSPEEAKRTTTTEDTDYDVYVGPCQ